MKLGGFTMSESALFLCTPGRAHSPGGGSPRARSEGEFDSDIFRDVCTSRLATYNSACQLTHALTHDVEGDNHDSADLDFDHNPAIRFCSRASRPGAGAGSDHTS